MRRCAGLSLALALVAGAAAASTVHVSADGDWWSPVYAAQDGDVIVFAPGVYENMDWYNPAPHEVPITLQGGPGVKAPFIRLQNGKGWIFDGWEITSGNAPDIGLSITGSTDVVVDHFHITAPPGVWNGLGANIRYNVNVTIRNSTFDHRGSGIGSGDNVGLTIDGNTFHDIVTDGIIACGETDLTINNNSLKDFFPHEGDHPDAIQWCSSSTHLPVNLTISNNRIERGAGRVTQGIFGEQGTHVVIRGNALLGVMYNGISFCDSHLITLDTNFLQPFTDIWTKAIVRCASSDVTARNNTLSQLVNYTEPDGTANTGYWRETGTVLIGEAPVGDRSAYLAWIESHQGQPPTPPVTDEIARLQAENAALRAIIDRDSFAFATIRGALDQARPPAPTPYRRKPLRSPPSVLNPVPRPRD
jgi:hypothetical protein